MTDNEKMHANTKPNSIPEIPVCKIAGRTNCSWVDKEHHRYCTNHLTMCTDAVFKNPEKKEDFYRKDWEK